MRYLFGEFELDCRLFQLRRGGEVVKLEPKIFDVLAYLIRNRDRVVSKDELLDAIWPGEFVSDSVLPRCIANARKALGDARSAPTTIATVHGRGYRFIAPLTADEGGEPAAGEAPALAAVTGPPAASPFVGRDEVLARMHAALADAGAGRGRMLLLVGEPGIGKTRTADELAAEARRRGIFVASGRCHEGEGAPAYWPWVQVLRGCIRGRDVAAVAREMGAGAPDIALLLPEVEDAAATAQVRSGDPALAPDEARFRLFDSVTSFLGRISERGPLVLLLDDLHWADNPSLLLLEYLAREMRETHLLVVGTYRDVELRRHHPLVRVLGDLAREPHCERLLLRGLAKGDVGRLIEARLGRSPSAALVDATHEMTEGNPFFIGEIAGLLAQPSAERTPREEGDWAIVLPQSVREAIGRRLDGLSPECNRVLAAASVIGRDFDAALLERALRDLPGSDAPLASLLESLDEAVTARVIEVESAALGRYAFAHALVRQTLYEELPIPLRLRLHQRVAEALEEIHAGDLEPHLAGIAHHLFQAAAAGNAGKAVDYAVRAAKHAFAAVAYEEAAGHYERVLQLLDFGTAPAAPEERFEILLALADAQSVSGNRERSQENCRRASAIARHLGRPDLLARAALVFGQRAEAGPLPALELRALLEEARQALGEEHLGLQARVLSRLSATPPYQDSIETRAVMSREAVELARRAGDGGALFDALAAQLWALLGPDQDEERLRAAADLKRLIDKSGARERTLVVLEHRARTYLSYGDLAAADRETQAYQKLAGELRQPSFLLFSKWYWVARALGDGRIAEAEALMRECAVDGKRLQHPAALGMLLWQIFWLLRQRGDLAQIEHASEAILRTFGGIPGAEAAALGFERGFATMVRQYTFEGMFVPSVAAYVYHEAGQVDQANEAFEQLAAYDFADVPRDEWWMPVVTLLAEVAAGRGDVRRCRALYQLLEPFAERNAAHTLLRTYAGSTAHFLGTLAAVLRRPEESARHFEEALQKNAALGARPALVRTQFEYGRLLAGRSRRTDTRRGLEMLQQAAISATAMGLGGLAGRIQKEIINSP